ncbi:MAG: DUF3791 domain-containing protein [Oscillospiraceae bacterium]|nr:DUF3791 domain-containing protein [Oscillospiraceae bacterium]
MKASRTLLGRKYARVIEAFSQKQSISLNEAMDIFYKSETYQEMSNGVSDMHCRSDEYLADELALE